MAENKIDKFFFDCQTKEAANEFKQDMLDAGVPSLSVKLRKVAKTNIHRLTVSNDNDEIRTVINMLMGREYGLSMEEIQDFLKIQFVLPETPETKVPESLSSGDERPTPTVAI